MEDLVVFDYSALKGRTAEMGKTDRDIAIAASMNPSTYSQKINGKGYFTQPQILKICDFLRIEHSECPRYFFVQKV